MHGNARTAVLADTIIWKVDIDLRDCRRLNVQIEALLIVATQEKRGNGKRREGKEREQNARE